MKHLNVFLSIAVAIALFTSCDRVAGGLIAASSAANEVLVIIENRDWEEDAGRAIADVLHSPTRGLPQMYPNFRTIQIAPDHFTRTFRTARNVVIPNISSIYSAPALRASLDVHAVGQVILNINAPDTASFVEFLTTNKQIIVDYLLEKELERNARWLMNRARSGPLTRAQEMFGINIFPPRGVPNVNIDTRNFYWASNNAVRARRDLVIYQFPYTTPDIFQKDSLIAIRNRIMGEHIKGSFDSQMTTSTVYPPHFRVMTIDGMFRAELRGLWEMTTDFMGGPFVMHAFVNENTAQVVVVEVFTFSPEAQTNTRNLIRNMEASLYTISVPRPEGFYFEFTGQN